MTVISVVKDPENQKVIITARFEASAERVWRLWSDPIQLERWWGPPAQLMTVVEHDLKPGGRVSYFVTGSDSHRTYGWWDVRTVEPPHRLDFDLGDARIPTVAVRVARLPLCAAHFPLALRRERGLVGHRRTLDSRASSL